jgi:tetratricopeptide (TPR) repeat protein
METPAKKIARRFLTTGNAGVADDLELTNACVRLVLDASRKSFRRSLALSELFVRRSRDHSTQMRMMALRLSGQMNQFSGQHAEALEAYRQARRLAGRDVIAKAGMDRMLVDIYMYLARYRDATRAARRAMTAYSRAGMIADWHKTRVNYANVLHRLDRHADAREIYREAAQFFEESGVDLAAARCRYNLGNTLVQLFEIEEADSSYRYARSIYERENYELDASDVRYGQAWLSMLKGDLHIALSELSECERFYRKAGNHRGAALCTLDLAEVSLGLGLNSDALDYARKAERHFDKLKLRYEYSKSALFRAQAALSLGKNLEATASARRARTGFRAEKNLGFTGVTNLLFADLSDSRNGAYSRQIKHAFDIFKRSQLPLWQAVCDLRMMPLDASHALKRLARNNAVMVVPHLYASWQTALGDSYHAEGKSRHARACWTRAADKLDTVRSQLPPVELRSTYGRSLSSPHVRLVAAEASRDPRLAAVWSERLKTAGVWALITPDALHIRERQRVTTSLDAFASQVAYLMRQVPGLLGEHRMTVPNTRRALQKLQRQIRVQFSQVDTAATNVPDSLDELDTLITKTSKQLPIVQFHLTEDDILAFVHQNGKTKVCQFRGGRQRVSSALERWRFFMERELVPSFPGRRIDVAAEGLLWDELGKWLWQPLQVDPTANSVLIIGEGELANLPWQALTVEGRPLCLQHHLILAPSLRHFAAAGSIHVTSPSVMTFRGDGGNLTHIDTELQELQKALGKSTVAKCVLRRADWPTEGESRLWHYSGHAVLRHDNPFYSYLVLADGPLFAADFRMRRCRVGLVTLAACRTGEQVALPGEESTGLVRSLLEMGVRNVIAGQWPVSDESASEWMTHFYRRYFDCVDLFAAAREAAMTVREKYPSAFHWSAFSVFGAGRTGDSNESN